LGEIYTIGSDDEFSVHIALIVVKHMRPGVCVEDLLEFVKDRDFNDYRYCIKIEKLRSLGWKPEIPFQDGIERVITWYAENQMYWSTPKVWLVYGSDGWIGRKIKAYVKERGDMLVSAVARGGNQADVLAEVEKHLPDQILSVLGRTHSPGFSTINYLEQKGQTRVNIRDNLYAPFVLAKIAEQKEIHFTYLGTGCIFSSDRGDVSFDEMSEPNFFGSEYSTV
jgi:UDP-glucose 4,6-dehydratase